MPILFVVLSPWIPLMVINPILADFVMPVVLGSLAMKAPPKWPIAGE